MIIAGLTGSIGTGKSTVAGMMRIMGIPVHEADAAVHAALTPGTDAYRLVCEAFPAYTYPQIYKGGVFNSKNRILDRRALGDLVFADPEKRRRLESILHPQVHKSQDAFIKACRRRRSRLAVLDIPLLFETGAEARLDTVICLHTPDYVQKSRVLARPGMTEARLRAVLDHQMPQDEKCARADYVIHTGLGRADTYRQVRTVIAAILHSDRIVEDKTNTTKKREGKKKR